MWFISAAVHMHIVCRFFGMVGRGEINQEFYSLMPAFQEQAAEHPHGWGFGWYDGESARAHKDASSAFRNPAFLTAARKVRSKVIIAHIRKTVPESIGLENTHPFLQDQWLFGHNGTVDIKDVIRDRLPPPEQERLKRSIDSEIFFHWILLNIREEADVQKGIRAAIEFVKKNR